MFSVYHRLEGGFLNPQNGPSFFGLAMKMRYIIAI
jgi:hypothetical protein